MPRLLLAALLFPALSSSVFAQTVNAIIPLSKGQTVAGGFRDIPPGPWLYSITLQSDSGAFTMTNVYCSNGNVSWAPQGSQWGSTAITWVTMTPLTESQIGTASGGGMFMDYQSGSFYTTNATFSGGDLNPFIPGIYQDPGDVLQVTDFGSPPSSFPASRSDYYTLYPFSILNYHDGYLWFTSDDSNVAVYWLDTSSSMWLIVNQPTFFAASGGNFPAVQFAVRIGSNCAAAATVTLHYRSVDSINPGGDGDTLDILNIVVDGFANPPVQ